MKIVKTKSFELAVNIVGDENSQKLAIILPGRLDTKDYAPFPAHQEFLAKKGFLAVSFDPPGTWESPGGIELFTTTNYIKAVNELIEYFGNKPTLLMGHSRGGAVSILAGASNPHVVCISPVLAAYGEPTPPEAEWQKIGFKLSYRDMPPGSAKSTEQKEFKLPMSYFLDGKKYSAAQVLSSCTKPKLLFYGDNDAFTSVEEAKSVFSHSPEPKLIHELHTEHDYRYHSQVIEEVNRVVGEFLDKYFQSSNLQGK